MKENRIVFILGLVCLIAALATGRDLFYNLTYLIVAIIVLSYLWTWTSIRWVHVTRYLWAKKAEVGRTSEERFTVRNTSLLPKLWLEVRDHSDLPDHQASHVINSFGARKERGWTVRTLCRQRGRFTLGPITLISGDPFGIFKMQRELPQTSPIIVYPAIVELPSFATPSGQLPGGEALRRRTHYVTTNVRGVRDYAPGDSFNRIHWPSTARKGHLIVKEFELDPMADVWLFLDMAKLAQAELEWEPILEKREPALLWTKRPGLQLAPSTEEYGVTVTASLAKHFIVRNRAVGMVSYAQQREVIPADRGERQLSKILETLAVIKAWGRIPLAQVLAAEGLHLVRGTTIIVITPSTDKKWVTASRHLEQRGLRVTAVLVAPDSFGGEEGMEEVMVELAARGTPTHVVRKGDDLAAALSQRTWEAIERPRYILRK
ncbi:MAG: DUF58 domain-containing protein [Chloroflexi bacterium]|nr:DUF58 domain-containing protein [Chloroflexota bacterium]